MGKKAKIGKQRKDKYYQLAKETGYRSRSSFKLIQLNRKFGFLQKSRVLVDLCAAPGGWMQVAKQNMPVSSVVIGVDLFPIKPVPGCLAVVEDITTEKCKQTLQRELKTWKADVVLHDGAPNVGKNWLYDAHQQSLLTLSAAKLSTQFLRSGGWFISKVFRSKDYNALIWVLKQLFKKVHATKPQASRNESAEIFVVCQGFIAPDKLDARFFDPKHVFEELELEPTNPNSIFHPEKQKKAKAEGYPEGVSSMHRVIYASTLIGADAPVDLLQVATEIKIDQAEIANHPKTTEELKACLKDIKVLGRKDLRLILNWSAAVKATLAPPAPVPVEAEKREEDEEEDEDALIAKQLADLKEEERKELKRKKKAVLKERRKLQERLNLKMVVKGDDGPTHTEGEEMFALKSVNSQKDLENLQDNQTPDDFIEETDDTDNEPKKKKMAYDPKQSHLDSSGTFYKETDSEASDGEEEACNLYNTKLEEGLGLSDSELSFEEDSGHSAGSDQEDDYQEHGKGQHPLLTDLDPRTKTQRRVQRAQLWFEKDAFQNLETEADEDLELDALAKELRDKGGKIVGEEEEEDDDDDDDTSDSGDDTASESDEVEDSGEDSASDYEMPLPPTNNNNFKNNTKKRAATEKLTKADRKAGFQVVPQTMPLGVKRIKLDEEGLAMGSMIATSRKKRRDFEDAGWHRFTSNDEHLPDWFVDDEKKHWKMETPVSKEMIDELKKRAQELNARPIKKVIEAKARKKKRAVKKLERAKKKVESIMESSEVSEREKARQVQQLYKKAAVKKPETTYVVSRRHTSSKRARRPPGVKGPYKVVDPRLKKDTRAKMRNSKKRGKSAAAAKGKRGGKPNMSKGKKKAR